MVMRQIVLDTETTGLSYAQGHRIIEIGCIEILDRQITDNHYHQYINPEREVDAGALQIHGLDNKFLADYPVFADVIQSFHDFIQDSDLIIHNAKFDLGFLNHEISLYQSVNPDADYSMIKNDKHIIDTLLLARDAHPGHKNSLDALCKRYNIDASDRKLHGALLDSSLLAKVYLAMTGGQLSLNLDQSSIGCGMHVNNYAIPSNILLCEHVPSTVELGAHNNMLDKFNAQ